MKRRTNLIRYKNVSEINVDDPDHLYYLVCEWRFSYAQIREAVRKTQSTDTKTVHEYLIQQKAMAPRVPPAVRITKFVHESQGL